MMGAFGGFAFVLVSIVYLLVILFLLWLTFRFVQAHERMADGINRIEHILREQNRSDHNTDI